MVERGGRGSDAGPGDDDRVSERPVPATCATDAAEIERRDDDVTSPIDGLKTRAAAAHGRIQRIGNPAFVARSGATTKIPQKSHSTLPDLFKFAYKFKMAILMLEFMTF